METSLATKPRGGVSGTLRFRYLGPDEIEVLSGLWRALHAHHTEIAPHLEDLITSVDADESWRRRRSRYLDWLADPDTLAVLAERDGEEVGYAMVTLREDRKGSWERGERVAVVQTLSVLPEARGTGVGSGLLEEIRRQLGAMGVHDMELAAITTNSDAIRFYEREGFRPFVTTLVSRIGAGPHD
ncbi:N-acetyltransferase family protein [Marinactinospora thermotolerans]|uniref:Acetyltransferases n=1 Tax=Marinactinospora thermotolerans DSM 45154 TaxID=1122192 RepID=A0A1T4K8V8_9ACTN|nr:GNAT family N-acetyltransferase [Marinactinospora thermotolerans]SJZ38864.1 Acetyltransferases [Marinactinospora thermotolerans DSM 45154]